jgi:hypothetical protein
MVKHNDELKKIAINTKGFLHYGFTLYPIGKNRICVSERSAKEETIKQVLKELNRICEADYAWHDEWEYFPNDQYMKGETLREGQHAYKILVPLQNLLKKLETLPSGLSWINPALRDCFHQPTTAPERGL